MIASPAPQIVVIHDEWQPQVQPHHAMYIPASNARMVQQPQSPHFISADPNNTYRVQVGSFRVARNAVDTFVRLRAADFEPAYERSGEFFRVVLMGIRGTEVQSTLDRLGELGYDGVMVSVE